TISPADGDSTLRAAVRSVVEALDHIRAPRALCEVRAHEDDYHWLCAWAAALSRRTVRWWLDPAHAGTPLDSSPTVTLYEGVGSLFLLLAAEVARREAREGFVWAA